MVISPDNPVSKVRLFEYSNLAITARGYVSCDCSCISSVPHDIRGILGESLNGSRLPHKFPFPVNKESA